MIATVLAMITTSMAQIVENDTRGQIQLGIKAGLNFSNVYDAQGEEFHADGKVGLALGGFIAIPIGAYLGLQPEVLLSQKGFKATGKILGSTYDFKRTTTYIDVPILFALKPIEYLTILAGPQYSYLIKQNDVFTNATTSIQQEQEFENDNLRRNIFGFVGGLDVNMQPFVFSVRVGWDISKNNGDGTSTTPRYKNVWYQATIGLRF